MPELEVTPKSLTVREEISTAAEEEELPPILQMPDEILLVFFAYLDTQDQYAAARTCRRFYTIFLDKSLHKTLSLPFIPIPAPVTVQDATEPTYALTTNFSTLPNYILGEHTHTLFLKTKAKLTEDGPRWCYIPQASYETIAAKTKGGLKRLSIEDPTANDMALGSFFEANPNLEDVHINSYTFTSAGLITLSEKCPKLKTLSLTWPLSQTLNFTPPINDAGFEALINTCPLIQEMKLHLWVTNINNPLTFSFIKDFSALKRLTISDGSLNDDHLRQIALSTSLEHLEFHNNNGTSTIGITALAAGCPNLKKLVIPTHIIFGNFGMVNEDLKILARGLPSLEKLVCPWVSDALISELNEIRHRSNFATNVLEN